MTKHAIPVEVLAQHTAILGKTGSGKTSTSKLAIEQVVADGFHVCVLDTIKSDWWGLISSADGKKPGLPFKVLGGPRGHVPLHASAGKAIGRLVGSGKLPLSIVDMADFEPGGVQKFFSEFAAELMRSMQGVLYLVIEEAHEVAPKERAGFGGESICLHYAKKLATAGRSKGIRLIVATQRVQSLHNAVLGSCETVIAHRLGTPADQAPVVGWLKANTDKATAADVESSLSSLPTGTAWVCSGEARIFEKIAFPKFSTYDNAKTPTRESHGHNVKTAAVDLDELRAIMGDAVAEAEANDPKALKAQIADLKKQLAGKSVAKPTPSNPEIDVASELKKALAEERPRIFDEGRRVGYAEGEKHALSAVAAAVQGIKPGDATLMALPARSPARADTREVALAIVSKRQKPEPSKDAASGDLGKPAQALLAEAQRRFPAKFTWGQLCALTKRKARGGSFNSAKQELLRGGHVTEVSGFVIPAVSEATGTTSQRDLLDVWCEALPSPADALLREIAGHPRGLTLPQLAELTGRQPRGGSWNGAVSTLRSNGLIREISRGVFVLASLNNEAA